jgi:hypothetical protein
VVKRLLWLGVGAAIGVMVVRKLAKSAEAMSPAGIAGRLKNTAVTAGGSVRSFMADVADGMHEREAELQQAIAEGRSVEELLEDDDTDDDSGKGGIFR